jgi:WD40 repeat protein
MQAPGDTPAQLLRPHSSVQASSSAYVLELAATPGRDMLAAALSDGSCRQYAVRGAALDLAGECSGQKGAVTGLMVHPDAPDLLLSSSVDGTVRGWDMRSGQQIEQCAVLCFRPATMHRAGPHL